MSALGAQATSEVRLTIRRGESVLLTLGIPLALLVVLSGADVLPLPDGVAEPVDFLFPGILALAVLSAALVGPAIAVGFDRQYGVVKRLGTTPLGRSRFVTAKIVSILAVEVLQVMALGAAAVALGWRADGVQVTAAIGGIVLATIAFSGLGMLLGGVLPGLTTLAAANGLYVLLLLLSGMVFPVERLPGGMEAISRLLPSTALAEILQGALRADVGVDGSAWTVLAAWALLAPPAATRLFRWS